MGRGVAVVYRGVVGEVRNGDGEWLLFTGEWLGR